MTILTMFRPSFARNTAVAVTMMLATFLSKPSAPLSAAAVSATVGAGTKLEPLFTHVNRPVPALARETDDRTIRRATIMVSPAAFAEAANPSAEAHFLNLFPDVQIVAERSQTGDGVERADAWFGSIPGDKHGRVIITISRGQFGALVTYLGRHYMVLPAVSGFYDVLEVAEDSLPVDSVGGRRRRSQIGMSSVDVDALALTMESTAVPADTVNGFVAPMVGDYLGYFNIPQVSASGEVVASFVLRNKLREYIDGATPGSEIRGHITTISHIDIKDALVAARDRGVIVYLVQDGQSSPVGDMLEAEFGTRHKYCYDDAGGLDGPITSCVSSIDGARHHLKNWYFSNTYVGGKTRTYSTWVTSYNLTATSDRQFNDAFVVNDNYALYAAYVKSFASFYGQHRSSDFYNVAGRGHHVVPSANTEISYAPQTTSRGHSDYHPTNDHVAMALSRIDGREPECSLKVAMLSISGSRSAIVDELLRIRGLGCRVQVAYSSGHDHGGVVDRLLNGNVEVHRADDVGIHSKMMVYRGRYDGHFGRTMVWGGSHNWTLSSLRVRDEVFVAISRLGLYMRYSDYFDIVWKMTTPVTRFDFYIPD